MRLIIILLSCLVLVACNETKNKNASQQDNETITQYMNSCQGLTGVGYNECETRCSSKTPE
jgi:hypothetical protein